MCCFLVCLGVICNWSRCWDRVRAIALHNSFCVRRSDEQRHSQRPRAFPAHSYFKLKTIVLFSYLYAEYGSPW
jgi:hypothetical protein